VEERRLAEAATGLAQAGDVALDEAQLAVLLRLLDLALMIRTGAQRMPIAAAAHGVRLLLTPQPAGFATIVTKQGELRIDGFKLSVTPTAPASTRPVAS
jgi:hypothetical protein